MHKENGSVAVLTADVWQVEKVSNRSSACLATHEIVEWTVDQITGAGSARRMSDFAHARNLSQ